MASPLFALPTETLLQITSYLTTPELGHVRLSCRWMERKLFDFFAKEFFSVRQVMFSEISLRALVAISEHSQLALYVKKVIVGLDTIQSWNSGYITSSTTPSLVDYKKLKAQDEWLKKSGEDRVLLASALQKFRNCRNIGMRDFYSQRQRSRDATAWKSWGVNTLLKSHQFSTAQPRGYDATQALTVILRASAQSDVKIESIEMITRSSHANYDTAFYVPESLQTDYARTFQHLKVLMLCINNTRGPDDGTYDVVEHLGNFLGFAPNLRHLRLNGSPPGLVGDIQHRGTNQKGRWVDLFAMLATVLAQSKLERLEFGTSTLPGPETTHLFKVLSSLEHLTLYRVFTVGRPLRCCANRNRSASLPQAPNMRFSSHWKACLV